MLYFLVYGKNKEKQKEFKNVMSFRGKIVSTGQLYKTLAEKHKCRKYSNLRSKITEYNNILGYCFMKKYHEYLLK